MVFTVFVVFVSCGGVKSDTPPVFNEAIQEAEAGPLAEAAALDGAEIEPETAGPALKPAFLVLNMEEGQDLILHAYKDPVFRKDVTAFFGEMTGSRDIAQVILTGAVANDIPPALAFSLCKEESSFHPRALNRNRNETVDRGLFQLNSASFPKLTVEDFFDPAANTRHGLSHLRWCLNTAGTEVAALAMYNAGATRVRSTGTPKSTLDYVSRILKRQRNIEELFMAEYSRIAAEKSEAANAVAPEKPQFRLSLLTPLGRK